LRGPLRGQV